MSKAYEVGKAVRENCIGTKQLIGEALSHAAWCAKTAARTTARATTDAYRGLRGQPLDQRETGTVERYSDRFGRWLRIR